MSVTGSFSAGSSVFSLILVSRLRHLEESYWVMCRGHRFLCQIDLNLSLLPVSNQIFGTLMTIMLAGIC
jgi:hypothetical protein